MARTAASHGVGALIGRVALAGACALSWSAWARPGAANDEVPPDGALNQTHPAANRHANMDFDIAPQGLQGALEQFSAITGHSGISDASVTMDKQSPGVHGVMTPDEALMRLTAGTGLRVRYASENTFVVVPVPDTATGTPAPGTDAGQAAKLRYFDQAQADIRRAFCGSAMEMPRDGRLALSFWLDTAGNIKDVNLLDSTGSPESDARLVGRLRGLHIADAMPAGLRQPITMVIRPGLDPQGACHE